MNIFIWIYDIVFTTRIKSQSENMLKLIDVVEVQLITGVNIFISFNLRLVKITTIYKLSDTSRIFLLMKYSFKL